MRAARILMLLSCSHVMGCPAGPAAQAPGPDAWVASRTSLENETSAPDSPDKPHPPAPTNTDQGPPPVSRDERELLPKPPANAPVPSASRLWIDKFYNISKWEAPTIVLGARAFNPAETPAWFVLVVQQEAAMSPGVPVHWSGARFYPAASTAENEAGKVRASQLCVRKQCYDVVLVPPGQTVTFESSMLKTKADPLPAELWRLSALKFDGIDAEEWLGRHGARAGLRSIRRAELMPSERTVLSPRIGE